MMRRAGVGMRSTTLSSLSSFTRLGQGALPRVKVPRHIHVWDLLGLDWSYVIAVPARLPPSASSNIWSIA